MLFEEFIEQHRVYGFVADRVRLALVIASDQIGVYFFDLLGYQPELRDPLGIKFLLVAEGHGFQRKDSMRVVKTSMRASLPVTANTQPPATATPLMPAM